jgi:hypothetical protein
MDEHSWKAAGPIFRSFDGDSNVTADIDLQPLKQSSPIFSREDGIQIDCRDEHFSKAPGHRFRSFDGDSNVTVDIDLHPLKQ